MSGLFLVGVVLEDLEEVDVYEVLCRSSVSGSALLPRWNTTSADADSGESARAAAKRTERARVRMRGSVLERCPHYAAAARPMQS